jgi:hypothetical protein
MTEASGSWDLRLYATVVGVLLCALGLATLLVHRTWSGEAQTPTRFLGLDEPAQALRPRP